MASTEQELTPLPDWYGNEDIGMGCGSGSSERPNEEQRGARRCPPVSPNSSESAESAATGNDMREPGGYDDRDRAARGSTTTGHFDDRDHPPIWFIEANPFEGAERAAREGEMRESNGHCDNRDRPVRGSTMAGSGRTSRTPIRSIKRWGVRRWQQVWTASGLNGSSPSYYRPELDRPSHCQGRARTGSAGR
jgi:hypothetical protein